MSDYLSQSNIKQVIFEGVVTRCGCTDKQKSMIDWHGHKQVVCPNPRKVDNLGKIAYYTKNPLKALLWKLQQLLKG